MLRLKRVLYRFVSCKSSLRDIELDDAKLVVNDGGIIESISDETSHSPDSQDFHALYELQLAHPMPDHKKFSRAEPTQK